MSRRARPTLRVLREDLGEGWPSPFARRAVEQGDIAAIQPLNALDHPILQKASSCFAEDPVEDSFIGPISSVRSAQLLEIKNGQWRAGVVIDDDACWVVAAGLAKGGHKDHDDFYRSLERREESGMIPSLLPTPEDLALLKQERASIIVQTWQREVQNRLIDALRAITEGGDATVEIPSPSPHAARGEHFARIDLGMELPEDDYPYEDVTLGFSFADRWKSTQLRWHLTVQVLATVSPPEDGWDRADEIYSNLLEPGTLAQRVHEVEALHTRGEIARTASGTHAHFTHRRNLAQRTVEGTAVRALCGTYFVPRQDPDVREVCPACRSLHAEIPSE